MSNTDSTSVIELPRVGCLLPAFSVNLEQLIEHMKQLQKEDPEKYAEMNALFNACRVKKEDDEEDKPICGCCDEALLNEGCGKMVNHGCCSDGACGHEPPIEALCGECGTWDEEDEVWRCPDCQEKHENEKHNDEPPACETCKKPVWSNNDTWQIIHGCAVCQDCFDENEEAHKPNYGGRVVPRFNFQFSDGDERGQDIDGQWWVRVKSDKWDWDYEKEQEEEPPEPDGDGSGDE